MDTEYKTIVCFGDSVTLGIPHVAPEDTFPALLERRLNWFLGDAGPRVRTVNSGVGGENTVEALARFETAVAAYAPDIVTVEFGLNDIRPEPLKLVERPEVAANLRRVVDQCRPSGAQVILRPLTPQSSDKLHRFMGHWTPTPKWVGATGPWGPTPTSCGRLRLRAVRFCVTYSQHLWRLRLTGSSMGNAHPMRT